MHLDFGSRIGRVLGRSGMLPAEDCCAASAVAPGTLVAAARDLLELQTAEGERVPCEQLGTGVVEKIGEEGWILVGWSKAGVNTWVAAADLRSLGTGACLVRVLRCDRDGNVRSTKEKVVRGAALSHHWTVRIQAQNVLRAIRADGPSWTFDLNPMFKRVEIKGTCGCLPFEDDDAEALTAAEVAVH